MLLSCFKLFIYVFMCQGYHYSHKKVGMKNDFVCRMFIFKTFSFFNVFQNCKMFEFCLGLKEWILN